jgi:hypothetical protein
MSKQHVSDEQCIVFNLKGYQATVSVKIGHIKAGIILIRSTKYVLYDPHSNQKVINDSNVRTTHKGPQAMMKAIFVSNNST